MSKLKILKLPFPNDMTDEEIEHQYDNVKVKNKTYHSPFSFDWKDNPEAVMEEVNAFLKKEGVKIEFLLGNQQDDQYTFYVEKKKKKIK